jgi:hypothetical protein
MNQIGIRISGSDKNLIIHNNFSQNDIGLNLSWYSLKNIISNNEFSFNSKYGILIDSDYKDRNNYIFYNNMISNTVQAEDNGRDNYWNNSNQEGNYWWDYFGSDINNDGIGDTNIPHLGLDYYPIIEPNGWLWKNRTLENETDENVTENDDNSKSKDNGDNIGLDLYLLTRFVFLIFLFILIILIIILNKRKRPKKDFKKKNSH